MKIKLLKKSNKKVNKRIIKLSNYLNEQINYIEKNIDDEEFISLTDHENEIEKFIKTLEILDRFLSKYERINFIFNTKNSIKNLRKIIYYKFLVFHLIIEIKFRIMDNI